MTRKPLLFDLWATNEYLVARTGLRATTPIEDTAPYAVPTNQHGMRVATLPFADAERALAWADTNHLRVEPAIRDWAKGAWLREIRATATSRALAPTDDVHVDGLRPGTHLLPYQAAYVEASQRAIIDGPLNPGRGRRGIINADEPGMGKTISALAALRVRDWRAQRAIIVCPTSLTENWAAEVRKHFTDGTFTTHIATTRSPAPSAIPPGTDTIIIGWAILDAWADTLIGWGPDALIADEGHYAKGGKEVYTAPGAGPRRKLSGTARATAVISIAQSVAPEGLITALTGTPIINRPGELVALLETTQCLHLLGGAQGFLNAFCDPQPRHTPTGRTVWDYSGASNLLDLSQRLAATGAYIRRTKQHLIANKTLPPKLVDNTDFYDRETPPTPLLLALPDEQMSQYKAVEDEVAGYYAELATRYAAELRVGPGHVTVTHRITSEANKHLTRITTLRKAAALAKVPTIIDWVKQKNQQGERVVVAAHHREVVDAYACALGGLKIQGSMSPTQIEDAKRRFNTRPIDEAPALVISVEAGKTGHTLCLQEANGAGANCAWMILAEQLWTPGDEFQMQDRIWRIGQNREVNITNAIALGTIDRIIYDMRAKKRRIYDAAVNAIDPEALAEAERGAPGAIAAALATRRLGIRS